MAEKSLVVVSPPGGVGEVTAVKAATMGSEVKWFVVSSKSSTNKNDKLAFPKSILAAIEEAGGKVELAGAEATSLIREESTRSAANTWCGTADAMVCCFDGVENTKQNEEDKVNPTIIWKSAVKVAAKEASKSITGPKLAILSVDDEDNSVELGDDDDEESGGLFGLLGGGSKEEEEEKSGGGGIFGLFGGGDQVSIPSSLLLAMGRGTSKVRHGQLFGTPESSVRCFLVDLWQEWCNDAHVCFSKSPPFRRWRVARSNNQNSVRNTECAWSVWIRPCPFQETA